MKKSEVLNENDWHRADIVAELRKRGLSLRKLSVNAGLGRDTLKNALDRNWPKGEQIIADALNVPPSKIWPSRYHSVRAA